MPANDGTTRVWFLTMNDEEAEKSLYQFHSLEYDHQTASQLMLGNGLPQSYAQTLGTGIWDNCEILPKEETEQQGLPIKL